MLMDREKIIFKEEAIENDLKQVVGWHSTCFDNGNVPLSGGTHSSRNTARQIALAELIERRLFRKLLGLGSNVKFLYLDEYPSTSGFACGFNREKTKWRAVCEGLERWAWSKWIDGGFALDKARDPRISELGRVLLSPFSRLFFFDRDFEIDWSHFPLEQESLKIYEERLFTPLRVIFRVFIGETPSGVFAGSRVNLDNDAAWEHEIVEAHRNYTNYCLIKNGHLKVPSNNWFLNRVLFFGDNGRVAHEQINGSTNRMWPAPEVLFLSNIDTEIDGVFLWRCLFKDYVHWGKGAVDRFVI